jgi:hypothetical protein
VKIKMHIESKFKKSLLITTITLMMLFLLAIPSSDATYISLLKIATPEKNLRGDTVSVYIELNVLDDDQVTAISIEDLTMYDQLPDGLTYVSGSQTTTPSSTFTYTAATNLLEWDFGSGPFTTAPQAIIEFEVTVDMDAPAGWLINSAGADYTETVTQVPSSPDVTDTVFVIIPDIYLDKTVDVDKVLVDGEVTYSYYVENTGDVELTNIDVTDDVYGLIGTIASLASGADTTLTHTTTVSSTVVNTATAEGDHQLGTVDDSDSVTVTVIDPDIYLDKTVDEDKVLVGGEVTYSYYVENTGDVELTSIDVDDDVYGLIGTIASLQPGESDTLTHTTTVSDDVVNTATAEGEHQLGTVDDSDSVTVTVIDPDFLLEKSCSPETQNAPGEITWEIYTMNTGDVQLTVDIEDDMYGTIVTGLVLEPGEDYSFSYTTSDLSVGEYTNTVTATAHHQLGDMTLTDVATCDVEEQKNVKQFTDSGGFGGFTPPSIESGGLSTVVYELHSGPRTWWEVTYYFENSEAYLGDEFDGEGHYFILWDKWGGNLMALDVPPVAFDEPSNVVTLANGATFDINPRESGEDSYRGYVGDGIPLEDCCPINGDVDGWITMHKGDQQQGTNPGKGKGNKDNGKDGKSYDTDVRWEIDWLEPGEARTLTIYIAPGKNPGGVLQFSSPGCEAINTGPRVRVYDNFNGDPDDFYENAEFLYAIDKTIQLWVCVEPDELPD